MTDLVRVSLQNVNINRLGILCVFVRHQGETSLSASVETLFLGVRRAVKQVSGRGRIDFLDTGFRLC